MADGISENRLAIFGHDVDRRRELASRDAAAQKCGYVRMWIRVKAVGHGQSYNTACARKLTTAALSDSAVTWPCAHRDIFACRLSLYLSILTIFGAIRWVIAEQVLRAQFGRDGGER